ncbi:MAG TPA: hypothetical protein DFS52_11515 [Myxococcales bacterium]|jgi:hypothetical protein|nr:hypothetical protein [Myxococcales bacterium]
MARARALISLVLGAALGLSASAAGQADVGANPDAGEQADATLQETSSGQQPSNASEAPAPAACDLQALQAAAEADWRLREKEWCDPEELALLSAGVAALDACAGNVKPAERWVFPVARSEPSKSIGGTNGSGYQRARHLPCFATKYPGHPAHDLFVGDVHPTGRDRDGKPFEALAVEDGLVLVARDGWQPGDPAKGGNYVLLYLPARRWIAYYAHLESVAVKAGERIAAGQVLGIVGRTGKNAEPRRSPTHLHLGLWDAEHFRPINSYPLLQAARTATPGE